MYLFCCSATHYVAQKGFYIAFVATEVETADPKEELRAGINLLGPIQKIFVEVLDIFEPKADGKADGCYISKGYDPATHFETTVDDVLDMYTRITGKVLDLDAENPAVAQQSSE